MVGWKRGYDEGQKVCSFTLSFTFTKNEENFTLCKLQQGKELAILLAKAVAQDDTSLTRISKLLLRRHSKNMVQ